MPSPEAEKRYRIFLSSTNDPAVREYRLAARDVILEDEFVHKWIPVEMGKFTPSSQTSLQECRDKVIPCAVYMGILGPFYGSVNAEQDMSYTEYEYTVAYENQREIAIFMLPKSILSHPDVADVIIKQGPLFPRQETFKNLVNTRHTSRAVNDLEDFKVQVRAYLRQLKYPPLIEDETPAAVVSMTTALHEELEEKFDRRLAHGYTLNDLDDKLIDELLKKPQSELVLTRSGDTSVTPLEHLGLLGLVHPTKGLTKGAVLCFAVYKRIAAEFSACGLHLFVYPTESKGGGQVIYNELLRHNLVTLYREGMNFFRLNAGLKRIGTIGTEDRDALEIPEIALREALANALVHREYDHPAAKDQPTRIEVFSDRVEIISFGGLVEGVTESVINEHPERIMSRRRNPIIAETFMRMQLVELGGSGILRMQGAMKDRNLPMPEIVQEKGEYAWVKVIFRRPKEMVPATGSHKRPLKVFIAYARSDQAIAARLASDLRQREYVIWQDMNIVAGQDWAQAIENAIRETDIFVVLMTAASNNSKYTQSEIVMAQRFQKTIIPLLLDPKVKPPISLLATQYLPFDDDYEQGLARLQNVLSYYHADDRNAAVVHLDPFRIYLQDLYRAVITYLEETLTAFIGLEFEDASEGAVQNPMPLAALSGFARRQKSVSRQQASARRAFGSFAEALEYYDGRVLLLGEEGAGKTITLMSVAREAITRRLNDMHEPLPIIKVIGEWDSQKESLVTWLGEEYQRLGDEAALLLLDGLDELPPLANGDDPRLRFMEALEKIPAKDQIVVTSRTQDYYEIGNKINLNGAVIQKPLTDSQIQYYVESTPELSLMIREFARLKDFIRTPGTLSELAIMLKDAADDERRDKVAAFLAGMGTPEAEEALRAFRRQR